LEEERNRTAVQNEIAKINRSLRQIEQGINEPTKSLKVADGTEVHGIAANEIQANQMKIAEIQKLLGE
jgi:hypothetical protein